MLRAATRPVLSRPPRIAYLRRWNSTNSSNPPQSPSNSSLAATPSEPSIVEGQASPEQTLLAKSSADPVGQPKGPSRPSWDAALIVEEDPNLENRQPPSGSPQGASSTFVLPKASASRTDVDRWDIPKDAKIYNIHCKSSSNNTICSFTDPTGTVLGLWSGGSVGFKKGNRETYEAGYQCAIRAFAAASAACQKDSLVRLGINFKGFGQGRDAFKSAIMTTEGEQIREKIAFFSDRTPLKIGGTRAKKMQRR